MNFSPRHNIKHCIRTVIIIIIIYGEQNQDKKNEKEIRFIYKNDRRFADFNVYYTVRRAHTQITAQLYLDTGIRMRFVIKITNSFEAKRPLINWNSLK